MTLSGPTIIVDPTLATAVQANTILATTTMVNVPQLSATFSISVTVDLCRVLTLTPGF